jgi:Arabinose efflux permease
VTTPARAASRAGVAFIFVTLLLDSMGVGVIIPVLPKLITGFVGGDERATALYFGALASLYAAMQFLFAPIFGALSDRLGRRPVLLAALLGAGFDYVLLALAPTLPWLFVGRAVAGALGASATTASAYIADVTPPEKRGESFGMIGAAFGLGFIIGPAVGGLLGQYGTRLPFWGAAALTLANALYGLVVLPESLPRSARRPLDWARANPLGSLWNLRRYAVVFGLLGTFICLGLANQVLPSVWVLYTEKRFGWGESEVGWSLAFVGLTVAAVQGVLTRAVIPRLGDRGAIITGFLISAVGMCLFGLATQGWHMYAVMAVFALGGIGGPALQGLISKPVASSEQGELQGALTSLQSLTAIVGPLIATGLFAAFTGPTAPAYVPGAPLFFGGALILLGLILGLPQLAASHRAAADAR